MKEKIQIKQNREAIFSLPPEFPIHCYETDLGKKPSHVNPWHWHEEIQFMVVIQGTAVMSVETEQYRITEGNGLFIPSGLLHSSGSESMPAARYVCFNIHSSMLSFFRGSVMEQRYVLPYMGKGNLPVMHLIQDVPWQKRVLDKILQLQDVMASEQPFYELDTVILLLTVWKELLQNISPGQRENHGSVYRRPEVKKMMMYLQSHYREKISLDDLSRQVCMPKSACCRLFKQALHCTMLEYLTQWRIEKSVHLLQDTDASVTQIAYEVGFSDTSYFIKRFVQIMNCTPLQYRKSLEEKNNYA